MRSDFVQCGGVDRDEFAGVVHCIRYGVKSVMPPLKFETDSSFGKTSDDFPALVIAVALLPNHHGMPPKIDAERVRYGMVSKTVPGRSGSNRKRPIGQLVQNFLYPLNFGQVVFGRLEATRRKHRFPSF